MAINFASAAAVGLAMGVVSCVLDRWLAPRFAETAGASAESAALSPAVFLYLVVSTAAAFALLSVRESLGFRAAYYAVIVALLLWIASIDWRWRIIPNRLVYPSAVVAFVLSPVAQPGPVLHAYEFALIGFVAAGGIFFLFFLMSVAIYRRPGAFGLGDVKLAGLVGIALGFPSAVAAVFLATFAGAILAVTWGVVSRDRKAGFPYGPAIVAGAILALLISPAGGFG